MPKIKHIVLLRFKPDVPQSAIDRTFRDLAGLQSKIPGIIEFIHGPYSSHEGMNHGYTHGFIMTFTDAAARDDYLPHPDHEIVKRSILPQVDAVIAFDFEA